MPSPYIPSRTYPRRVPPSRVITVKAPPQVFTQGLTASLSFVGSFAKGLLYLRNFAATLFQPPSTFPTTNLVSYWTLDEASGTRFDSFGTNHLSDNATTPAVSGIQGNAAYFGGANYLYCSSNSSLQMPSTSFTIACWVNLLVVPVGAQTYSLVTKDDDAANSRDYTLDVGSGAGLRFYIKGGSSYIVSGIGPTANTWYFIVAWFDYSDGSLHMRVNDASQVDNAPTGGGLTTDVSAAQFRIGAREYAGFEDYANAYIDEVGLWKRVLTPTEITYLYNGGAGRTYSPSGGASASLVRLPNKSLTATLASTAALVKRIVDAGFTATLGFVGAVKKRMTLLRNSFTATLFSSIAHYTDNFNRADGSMGANWTTDTLYTALAIVSNTCRGSTPATHNRAIYNASGILQADQYAQCKIAITTLGSFIGLMLRSDGAGTFYVCYYPDGSGSSQVAIYKNISGTPTNLVLGSVVTPTAGDIMYFEAVGNTLTVKVNGVVAATVTDSSIIGAGYAGLGIYQDFGAADDFEAGTIGGGGAVATLTKRTTRFLTAGLSFVGTFAKTLITGGTTYFQSFAATLFSGAPPVPDLVDEGFETTGTPTNWFHGGSSDFDYATSPLAGSQSLRCNAATADYGVYQDGHALNHSEFWLQMLFKWEASGSDCHIFRCQDAGFNTVYEIILSNSSGRLIVSDSNGGGIFANTVDSLSVGTIYNVWGHYKKGTGSNAICEAAFDVAGNPRPSSGNKYVGGTTGNSTANGTQFQLTAPNSSGVVVYDNVKVSSTDIFGGAGGGPSATLSVRANKALTATLSFVAAFAKSFIAGGGTLFTQAYTATLTSTAAISRKTSHLLAATQSFVGALTRRTSHLLAATLSFVGAITKRSTRFLAGTLSFVGTFAKSKAIQQALSATLSFVGAVSAKIIATRAFTATLSFVGASSRRANKAFAATLSFVGALVKRIADAGFSATQSFVGALTKRTAKAFAATLSFIGNLGQTFIHGGTAFTQSLVATLSFVGSLSARGIITRAFTATLNATAAIQRSTRKLLAATLSSNASLLKRISRTFSAVVSSSAALVKFIRDAGFTATLSFVGNLTSLVAHFFTRAFTATLSFSATITRFRLVQRVLSASLAFSGAFQRRIGKSLTATLSFSTAIRRNVRKVLRGTLSFIGFIFKGGAVTVLAGWVTKCLATIGLAGSTANSTRAGSQLTVEKLDESGMKIQTTGSTLTVERTK